MSTDDRDFPMTPLASGVGEAVRAFWGAEPASLPEFIVAEVSKNWHRERVEPADLLSQRFEEVIEVNRQRGYLLYQFALNQVMVSADDMTETIIAVFRREGRVP